MGEGDRAVHLLRLMNPIEHAKTPSEVQQYKVEPYVVAADVYALENQHGRGGWTWYTGSAGWMYRVWIEGVLGLTVRGETLRLNPALPSDWSGFKLRYRHRTSLYEIVVEQTRDLPPNTQRWEEDGHLLDTPDTSLLDDGQTHRVRVLLGRSLSREGIEESIALPTKETASKR
jgi:cellobiose phosphorylase